MNDPSLRWLVDPIGPDEFLSKTFEREVLVINRERPDHWGDLLSIDDIDRALTTQGIRYPNVDMVNSANPVTNGDFTTRGNALDLPKVFQLFEGGATIILPALHESHPRLGALCRHLEAELSTPFQTNIYFTPPDARGFKAHYDTHCVFVLQVAGTKAWRIYDEPVKLPHRGQRYFRPDDELGEPSRTFELQPGDLAYVPRGVVHDAVATPGESSLHITLGVMSYTWSDLLLEALSATSLAHDDFRRSLPIGHAREGFDRTEARRAFERLLDLTREHADFDSAFDHFVDRLVSARRPDMRGQTAQIARLAAIDGSTRAAPRPALAYTVSEDEETVSLRGYGKTITLPRHAADTLRAALTDGSYAVRDLPGDLDMDGKVTLVRRLVREGLVRLL